MILTKFTEISELPRRRFHYVYGNTVLIIDTIDVRRFHNVYGNTVLIIDAIDENDECVKVYVLYI